MQAATPHLSELGLRHLRDKKRPVLALITSGLILLCLLFAGATSWVVWSSREIRLREAEVATRNMAGALASQADMTLKLSDVLLEDIVARVEHEGSAGAAGERLHAHLKHLTRKAAEIHGLFVYDDKGRWMATSLDSEQKGDNSDRDYFKFHKNNRQRETHISAPVRSKSTGYWIIPISRRVEHPDGTFAGVALASLRLDAFERVYDRLDLGKSGTVFVALESGTLLYRRPFRAEMIGMDISSGAILSTYRDHGPVGTAMLVAKLDGITRLYSYRRLERFPVVVSAALSKDEIFEEWRRFSMQIAAGAVSAVAALIWLFLKLTRQIAIRDHMEAALQRTSIELEKANADLQSIAMKDSLTELANRRAFDQTLAHELRRAQRKEEPVSLIMLDVDFFKKFNDHYGHVAGDDCLRSVAKALAQVAARAGDLAFRYGGEEFALLLPATDSAGARRIAEAVRVAVMAHEIGHAASALGVVTVSVGVATARPGAKQPHQPTALIQAADDMLYRSKSAGRNRVSS